MIFFKGTVLLNVETYENLDTIVAFINQISKQYSLKVICPSPIIADNLRGKIASLINVITISKWTQELHLNEKEHRVSKAELMTILGGVFKNYFPDEAYHLFYSSFELFTELRSFTLDLSVIADVLEEIDEKEKKVIQVFWAAMDAFNLVDEHLLYSRMSNLKHSTVIVFFGFKHMSAIQIDMMKLIATGQEVYVAIPYKVYTESFSSDWVKWLVAENKPLDPAKKMILNTIFFDQVNLYECLKEIKNQFGKFDLALAISNVTVHDLQAILDGEWFFKTSIDFFSDDLKLIVDKIKDLSRLENSSEGVVNHLQFFLSESIKNGNYIHIKIAQMMQAFAEKFFEYSQVVDNFFFSLLSDIVALNLPRNYLIPLLPVVESKVHTYDSIIYEREVGAKKIIVFFKEGHLFQSADTKINELVLAKLKKIGPIKRGGLENLFIQSSLEDLFNRPSTIVLIENGAIEYNSHLAQVLASYHLEFKKIEIENKNKKSVDVIRDLMNENIIGQKNKQSTFTPSRLQTYQDCPRKYFLNYVEKISNEIKLKTKLDVRDFGRIEHHVIERYFKEYQFFDGTNLTLLAEKVFQEYLGTGGIKINEKNYLTALFEIMAYAKNGLDFLYSLQRKNPDFQFYFEYPLPENSFGLKGRIDCLVKSGKICAIYDFKRSASSVGNRQDLESFSNLQLWTYALALSEADALFVSKIGLIDISEEESCLELDITNDQLANFEKHLLALKLRLTEDRVYLPTPNDESSCSFCLAKVFCPRTDVSPV